MVDARTFGLACDQNPRLSQILDPSCSPEGLFESPGDANLRCSLEAFRLQQPYCAGSAKFITLSLRISYCSFHLIATPPSPNRALFIKVPTRYSKALSRARRLGSRHLLSMNWCRRQDLGWGFRRGEGLFRVRDFKVYLDPTSMTFMRLGPVFYRVWGFQALCSGFCVIRAVVGFRIEGPTVSNDPPAADL